MNRPLIKVFILVLALSLAGVSACKKEPAPGESSGKSATTPEATPGSIQATGTADTEQPETPETSTQSPETSTTETQASENCTYSTDPKSIKVEWTAYKFTDKTPVKGTFLTTKINGPTSAESLSALAHGLSMDIDGASLESGDPGRNATVKGFFFDKFNPPFKLQAIVKSMNGSDTAGNLIIEINMNGAVKEVPFAYTATPDGNLTAKSGINLMNWNLQKAFDSIHQACEQLHTGKDGVAKTWEVVDLKLDAKYEKKCAQ